MFSSDKVWRWCPLGVALAAAAVLAVSLGGDRCAGPAPFDPAAWRKGSPAERGRMARSLCEGRFVTGRTRGEVLALLGEPDRDFGSLIEYDIDPPAPVPREEWVHIGFDKTTGRVREAKVQR
jgi:hypothetical protein